MRGFNPQGPWRLIKPRMTASWTIRCFRVLAFTGFEMVREVRATSSRKNPWLGVERLD